MVERRNKREQENAIELDAEYTRFVLEPTRVEVGSGYTLCVNYDETENPIVSVRTYGQVDVAKVRMEIEKAFPHAQIRQLNQAPSVIIVKKSKTKRSIKNK